MATDLQPGVASGPRRSTRLTGRLVRWAVWIAVFAAWEGAYRIFQWHAWVFPAPSHVLNALLRMLNVGNAQPWYMGDLVTADLISAARLLVGFVLSVAIGALLGLGMWSWTWLDELLGPLLLGVQTLPSVCWVPLAVLTFGYSEKGILFVLVMGSAFSIAIALRDGLKTMPPLYQRAGRMLGARGWKLYRYVLLPASLPAFASSLRQGFSFAWRSLLGAEMIMTVQGHGLGFLLATGRDFSDVSQVVAIMVVMVAIGMLADRWVFMPLQRAVNARFGLG